MKKILFLFTGAAISVAMIATGIAVAVHLFQPPTDDPAITQARTTAQLAQIARDHR